MKPKMYLLSFLVILTGFISFSFKAKYNSCKAAFKNYPSGASANLGAGYTGASWDNGGQTCGACHGGGSYNPTTSISLMSGSTPVTRYVPGTAYILNLKIASASGTPKYAFNVMCATTTAHTNINKWGTLPTGARNTTANARNYVEQTNARAASATNPTSYYSINIPWTAPAAGTGNVTFYAEGMAVNGTGGTGGDSPTPGVNITVTETVVVPVQFSSVTAVKQNGGVLINWISEQEINVGNYMIEHSTDGNHFAPIGDVAASKENSSVKHTYEFMQNNITNGKHFYRIVEVDLDGSKNYSQVVTINLDNTIPFTISPNPVKDYITLPVDQFTDAIYILSNINGMKVSSGKIQGSKINTNNLLHGTYVLSIIEKTGQVHSLSFLKD